MLPASRSALPLGTITNGNAQNSTPSVVTFFSLSNLLINTSSNGDAINL